MNIRACSEYLAISSVAVIRSQAERRLPGALNAYKHQAPEVFPTGLAGVDCDRRMTL